MASRNAEIARDTYALWNDGAFEEWRAMHHEEVVVIPPEGFPESETSEGIDAWFTQAMRLTEAWEEQRIEVEDVLDLPDERVLAIFVWVTRGKDSGITLETPMACLTTVRDGRLASHEFFLDREQAARAAGLERIPSR